MAYKANLLLLPFLCIIYQNINTNIQIQIHKPEEIQFAYKANISVLNLLYIIFQNTNKITNTQTRRVNHKFKEWNTNDWTSENYADLKYFFFFAMSISETKIYIIHYNKNRVALAFLAVSWQRNKCILYKGLNAS